MFPTILSIAANGGQSIGIEMMPASYWNQSAYLSVTISNRDSSTAISGGGGTWVSGGSTSISITNYEGVGNAIYLSSNAMFDQKSNLSISISGSGTSAGNSLCLLPQVYLQGACITELFFPQVQHGFNKVAFHSAAMSQVWFCQQVPSFPDSNSPLHAPEYGVSFNDGGGKWYQVGPIQIASSGASFNGIQFQIPSSHLWYQNGSAVFTLLGTNECGININASGTSPWDQAGDAPTFSITSSNNSFGVCPPLLPTPASNIQASFSQSIQTFTISAGNGPTIHVGLASLDEVSPSGEVVKSNPLNSTQWTLVNRTGGSENSGGLMGFGSSTFTFQTVLDHGGLLLYTFNTFATSTTVSLPNNQTFQESSQYLKFSFEVAHWDFLSASDKLQFVLSIQPAFNSTQIRSNTPQVGITTILLETMGPSNRMQS